MSSSHASSPMTRHARRFTLFAHFRMKIYLLAAFILLYTILYLRITIDIYVFYLLREMNMRIILFCFLLAVIAGG